MLSIKTKDQFNTRVFSCIAPKVKWQSSMDFNPLFERCWVSLRKEWKNLKVRKGEFMNFNAKFVLLTTTTRN